MLRDGALKKMSGYDKSEKWFLANGFDEVA
jgi:hypothetical protein